VTVLESLRRDLVALERAGAVSEATMRRFDVICPPPET
jgi:putative transcriptional regulator